MLQKHQLEKTRKMLHLKKHLLQFNANAVTELAPVYVSVGDGVAERDWLCKASNPTIAVVSSFFSVCWHVRNPKITDKAKMVLI